MKAEILERQAAALEGGSLLAPSKPSHPYHGDSCAWMSGIAINSLDSEFVLSDGFVVWLGYQLYCSGCWVHPKYLNRWWVPTDYSVSDAVWWVVVVYGSHFSNHVVGCKREIFYQ